MAEKKSNLLPWDRLVLWIIGIVVLFLVGFSYFWSNLTLSGEEFSPELFQVRAFSYWRLPGSKLRLSSTNVGTSSSPCTKQILNHLKPVSSGPTWQVTTASQGTSRDQLAPVVLTKYLSQKNPNGDPYWDDWSFRHPKQAAILWPVVQQAAIMELYICMPDLLRTAEEFAEDTKLNAMLKLICLRAAALKSQLKKSATNESGQPSLAQWARDFAGDVMEDSDVQDTVEAVK